MKRLGFEFDIKVGPSPLVSNFLHSQDPELRWSLEEGAWLCIGLNWCYNLLNHGVHDLPILIQVVSFNCYPDSLISNLSMKGTVIFNFKVDVKVLLEKLD